MTEMARTKPLHDASSIVNDPAALQRRAKEEGYLFFPGLIPQSEVLDLRARILEVAAARDWLDPGRPASDGVVRTGLKLREGPDPQWQAFYRDVLSMRAFHALAQEPRILSALETLFGETVVPHSRNICRLVFPGNGEFTTPPHQDHLYIGGTQETWTVWIPLGDCPAELGGLAVAPGSHRLGFLPAHPGKGPGGQQVDVPAGTEWALGEMHCGDALMLHSLTIHQGRDNQTQKRLRLSVDYRYQPLSHPIRSDSMEPHMAGFGLTWEDIYAGWAPGDPLRYYWRNWPLHFEPPAAR